MKQQLKKIDNLLIGFVIGIVIPIGLFYILKPLHSENFAFIKIYYQQAMMKVIPMLLSRCVIPNALLFFIFIWSGFDRAAKGMLWATTLIAFGLITMHFLSNYI